MAGESSDHWFSENNAVTAFDGSFVQELNLMGFETIDASLQHGDISSPIVNPSVEL